MPSDLEIARQAKLLPITDIARSLGLSDDDVTPFGRHKAKISARVLEKLPPRPNAKYIDVTAITPTPLGEGKTLTTVGLGMALSRIGKKTMTTIRQPSMGPIFGVKGGAAGGGRCQVVPMDEFNLHLTGDMHAVGVAHNLLAAWIDSSILLKNQYGLDPARIDWRRVVDINDRALREIEIGLGGDENGVPRKTGFDITPASEVMAILGLAKNIKDLRRRLGQIVVGRKLDGSPATAEMLQVAGAMAVAMRDAIHPTLMQTTDNTPVFVHAGPFANIAYGNSSVIADLIAVRLADYTVTESGFGADMGFEKLMNIKSRASEILPNAVVLVATVRGIKAHSGKFKIVAGKPLDPALTSRDLESLEMGLPNLAAQIQNVRAHGIPCVVAVNRFPTDHPDELQRLRTAAMEFGADAAEISSVHQDGAAGGEALARAVVKAAERPSDVHRLYDVNDSIEKKMDTVARTIYGASEVVWSPEAKRKAAEITAAGYGKLPVCTAKTQYSLSHDPKLRGAPKGYAFPVNDIRLSAGAGFLVCLAGEMKLMPGLGSNPSLKNADIDDNGEIVGLF